MGPSLPVCKLNTEPPQTIFHIQESSFQLEYSSVVWAICLLFLSAISEDVVLVV